MPDRRLSALRVVLVVVGLIFLVGVFPLTRLWPAGWSWGTGHSHYLFMILGVYATLGVFPLMASREPLAHRSLIWFAGWHGLAAGWPIPPSAGSCRGRARAADRRDRARGPDSGPRKSRAGL